MKKKILSLITALTMLGTVAVSSVVVAAEDGDDEAVTTSPSMTVDVNKVTNEDFYALMEENIPEGYDVYSFNFSLSSLPTITSAKSGTTYKGNKLTTLGISINFGDETDLTEIVNTEYSWISEDSALTDGATGISVDKHCYNIGVGPITSANSAYPYKKAEAGTTAIDDAIILYLTVNTALDYSITYNGVTTDFANSNTPTQFEMKTPVTGKIGESAKVPTVTSVTVSPAETTEYTAPITFTATVTGENDPAQTVTWEATDGTITADGVFTAPDATYVDQTITITATSTVDTSKSGTATVVVKAKKPEIKEVIEKKGKNDGVCIWKATIGSGKTVIEVTKDGETRKITGFADDSFVVEEGGFRVFGIAIVTSANQDAFEFAINE